MKKIIILATMMFAICSCTVQTDLKTFIDKFKPLKLPIDSVLLISVPNNDTLNGKQTNKMLIRLSKEERPFYVDTDEKLIRIKQYYGFYPDEPFKYGKGHLGKDGKWIDSICYFYSKILPIGRIYLNEHYISIIIEVISKESIFYDLWNLSKEGNPLSVICLFYGLKEGTDDETTNYTIVNSKITAKGEIIWHENNRGLETFRTYKLNKDGYFQVIKEEQKGEFEY
ncbi:hypothetical protein FACS1894156_8160 [Bacteroidia bacterium]|nr:hypothetical protein FACS1894156_8160 [Bacteroidia bacterium]